jgi:hypothetical protein
MAGKRGAKGAKPQEALGDALAAQFLERQKVALPEVDPVKAMVSATDREFLANWWRDQFAEIEARAVERGALMASVEDHPDARVAALVREYGALGIEIGKVARLLKMGRSELEAWYGHDYEVGATEVMALASKTMIRIATSSDDRYAVKAVVEFLNRRGGQEYRAPAQKLEIDDSRKNAGVIDSSKLTYEERQQLRLIVERAVGRRVDGNGVGVAGAIEAEAGVENGD